MTHENVVPSAVLAPIHRNWPKFAETIPRSASDVIVTRCPPQLSQIDWAWFQLVCGHSNR